MVDFSIFVFHFSKNMDLHNFFGYSVFSKTPMLRIFEGIFIFYIKIIDKLPEIFRKSFQ